jgi:hypothetical protein
MGEYLSAQDAAAYTGISKSTMAKMRCRGDGPAYLQPCRRRVVYARADLDNWLHASRRNSTSEV